MGLFDKLKEKLMGKSVDIPLVSKRENILTYIPTYNIEEWQPKLTIPKYDKMYSFENHLRKSNVSEKEIEDITKSENPFGKAKHKFSHFPDGVPVSQMCEIELNSIEKWIKLMTIWDADPIYIIENTFAYILLRLSVLCKWHVLEKKAYNQSAISEILYACKENDSTKVLSYFDSVILSCFAFAHLKSKKSLIETVGIGFSYLDMNTTHIGSAKGSFYNLYGKEQLQAIIGKVIECAYVNNKFSLKTLLIKEKIEAQTDNVEKYDVKKMKQFRGCYLPLPEYVESIKEDVLVLNEFLSKARELTSVFPQVQINSEDLVFRFDKIAADEPMEFCSFMYNPTTPTGKASKYPLQLGFWCKRTSASRTERIGNGYSVVTGNGIQGEIDFLQNSELGKARIIISHNGCIYIVSIIDKKGIKVITKIEQTNKNGVREEIYNINK